MLLYHNKSFWRIIFERRGSVVYTFNGLLCGLVEAAVTWVLCYLIHIEHPLAPKIVHHWGITGVVNIMVFAVVFRTNLGWSRYWEAMTQQHFMYSKWSDALTQFCAFANCTLQRLETEDAHANHAHIRRLMIKIQNIKKYFSLMSALAAHRLSHGDTQRMERRAFSAGWTDRVVFREDLRIGKDITGARVLPEFRHSRPGFTQSLQREWNSAYIVSDVPVGIESECLDDASDRVNVVMYWILHDMASASKDLDIAPPIQSRMYQELSNGMLGFNNSLKIADVPFPFPYAQLLDLALVIFSIVVPIYVAVFTESLYLSPFLAFGLFEGIWCFNEVAKELEHPYGSDANDMSLEDFHARFMSGIQELDPSQRTKKQFNAEFGCDLRKAKRDFGGPSKKMSNSDVKSSLLSLPDPLTPGFDTIENGTLQTSKSAPNVRRRSWEEHLPSPRTPTLTDGVRSESSSIPPPMPPEVPLPPNHVDLDDSGRSGDMARVKAIALSSLRRKSTDPKTSPRPILRHHDSSDDSPLRLPSGATIPRASKGQQAQQPTRSHSPPASRLPSVGSSTLVKPEEPPQITTTAHTSPRQAGPAAATAATAPATTPSVTSPRLAAFSPRLANASSRPSSRGTNGTSTAAAQGAATPQQLAARPGTGTQDRHHSFRSSSSHMSAASTARAASISSVRMQMPVTTAPAVDGQRP